MREARLRLRPTPRAAGIARRFVARYLGARRISHESVNAALLVTSEFVTNAFRHGEGEIELRLRLDDRRVRIEVLDEGYGNAPAVRQREPDETGGWGLRIVDQLALRWGVAGGATQVWAELAVS